MTTQIEEVKNAEDFISKSMNETLKTALKRFDVKVFLDWSVNEGQNVIYIELLSKVTGGRVTFVKSYFEASKNLNTVLYKLNLIGSANEHIHAALVDYVNKLIDDGEFTKGGYTTSHAKPLEWDDQVSMQHARSVVRYFILNKSRFVLQSSRSYDSSKHLGVILDEEKGLPDDVIAVGFKGGALQSVLNPRGRIQSQKYRREILGGLAHIGVLDAEIDEYDDEEDFDGYCIDDNGKLKPKSSRLDKQRVVSDNKNGVKFYIFHFSKSLLEEVEQYVAA